MKISEVQRINVERANRWHGGNFRNWSVLEWAGAMCGEAGEAANIAKKIRRVQTDASGNEYSDHSIGSNVQREALAAELADTFLYMTILAEHCGMDLEEAVRLRFNRKSEQMGFPERL